MYKYLSRPRHRTAPIKSFSLLTGFCFLALSVVAPAQIQKAETRVFSSGLKISAERSSPAFAALQDELSSPVAVSEMQPTGKVISISSGEDFSLVARRIEAANAREEQLALQKQMANSARIHVVEISREELLQTLFLPMVASLQKQTPTHSSTSPVHRYEENNVSYPAPAPKPDTLTTSISVDPDQPHLIRGLIEFADGLALTAATDELRVFHEIEGEMAEEGTVWLRQARYAIEVPNREGVLVAELRTAEGQLLGRGELELVHLPIKKRTQYKVSDVTLRLSPFSSSLSGRVLSAYSHAAVKKAVTEAEVEIAGLGHRLRTNSEGHFEDSQVLEGSSVIVQAQRAGYWGSLAIGTSKNLNEVILYPNKMLKAFMSFVASQDPALKVDLDTSLVWGKVTRNGRPVAGAQVDLMTTEKPLVPIYFNELMLPDKTLKATSSNGLYAFLPVPAGAHAVQVNDNGVLSEPIVFPTEARHVSTVDVETSSWKRLTAKSFDAFYPETPIAADFYRLGFEQERKRSQTGLAEIKFAPGSSLVVVNAVAGGDYVPSRVTLSRNRTYAYFPMVRASWLRTVIAGKRLKGTSLVVGFVQSKKPYRVFADGSGNSAVVYFDAKGNVVDGEMGVPGGGYIVINVETGFRSISVVPVGSDQVSATTVLADTNFVNLINHVIR